MKLFIEAVEQGAAEGVNADVIRQEVTGKQADAIATVEQLKLPGKTYKMFRHVCFHDEKDVKPCILEEM